MLKKSKFHHIIFQLLALANLGSCGNQDNLGNTSKLSFGEGTPCGSEKGAETFCRDTRTTDYKIRLNTLRNYTECGQYSHDKGKYWQQWDPVLDGSCAGVNAGKFLFYGPGFEIDSPGWVNATAHINLDRFLHGWQAPAPSPDTPVFVLDIYSASLGGTIGEPKIYRFLNFSTIEPSGIAGSSLYSFAGTSSTFQMSKPFPGPWWQVTVSAHVPQAVKDLEIRLRTSGTAVNMRAAAVDMTFTAD